MITLQIELSFWFALANILKLNSRTSTHWHSVRCLLGFCLMPLSSKTSCFLETVRMRFYKHARCHTPTSSSISIHSFHHSMALLYCQLWASIIISILYPSINSNTVLGLDLSKHRYCHTRLRVNCERNYI